jgi:hypothetical protein
MTHGPSKHASRVVQQTEGPDRPDPDGILAEYVRRLTRVAEHYLSRLDLRLRGCKATEIAPRLEISRQTVYWALGLLHQRLEDSDASACKSARNV